MNNYCIVNKNIVYITKDIELDDEILQVVKKYNKIEFCKSFNKSIDRLSSNITTIIFQPDGEFNQTVNNYPYNLETIIFGNNFNNPLDNLPEGVKNLKLGANYSHNLDNLPQLYFLNIGECKNIKLTIIPESIEMLLINKNIILPEIITTKCKKIIVYDKYTTITNILL